jgi:hypothetical protein
MNNGGVKLKGKMKQDQAAAAAELGYVFTFLLGVLLLSMFSVWAWDIENSTRVRWNEQALEENLREVAAAVERADAASRLDANSFYAEPVLLRAIHTDVSALTLILDDSRITLVDDKGIYTDTVSISGASSTIHSGEVNLGKSLKVWVIYDAGEVKISQVAPQ